MRNINTCRYDHVSTKNWQHYQQQQNIISTIVVVVVIINIINYYRIVNIKKTATATTSVLNENHPYH